MLRITLTDACIRVLDPLAIGGPSPTALGQRHAAFRGPQTEQRQRSFVELASQSICRGVRASRWEHEFFPEPS
ncbi:MAG: hypothetical protein OXD40_04465 [bacterium]|nr:hypothetical protein [bacterium]